MKMYKPFYIGQNTLNGAKMLVDYASFLLHWLIVGGTGRGKSKLLELILRFHLHRGSGFMLLDPHGFLYEDMLTYVTTAGYRDRVILVNANDMENSVGLNFLARTDMDVSAHAAQVMKAIAKVFGQEDGDVKPRLERWQRNLLMTLIEANLTLADMLDFLSVSSSLYREAALHSVTNPYVRREWEGFDAIKKISDKENLIEAPLNRAAKMILSDPIRRIVGQEQSTINIGEAVEKGKIVLVNLAPKRVSRECQQVLGILLVDQVVNYAFQRTKRQVKKPFFVFVDEATELTSNDLPYSLQALRKFGIFFTLCYQTLTQIKAIPGYYETVMSNTDVKVAFKTSRADSEELIGELFAGRIRGDEVKDEIEHTIQIPSETVREIVGTGQSESETHGEVDTYGESFSDGSGSGSSLGIGLGYSEHIPPDDTLLGPSIPHSATESHSMSDVRSEFSMYSSGSSSSHSDIHSKTTGKSTTRTIVPFYEYIRQSELSSRQFYSIQEIQEKYIAWIMCQPQRHAQIKIGDDRAIPILTAYVGDLRVREKDKQKVVDRSNQKYALPSTVVDTMIADRRTRLLEQADRQVEIQEAELVETRWQ
jgi:hypothetical protein